jgi:hypothetical protein
MFYDHYYFQGRFRRATACEHVELRMERFDSKGGDPS